MITIKTKYASDAPRMGVTLAPGFYNAVIVEAYDAYSDKHGKEYIALELDITDGSGANITIKDWIYVENSTVWRVEQLLSAAGKKFKAGEDITFDARKMTGRKLIVATYKRKADNGNIYASILAYLRPEDVPHMGAMTAEDMETFRLQPDGTKPPRNAPAQQTRQVASYAHPAQTYRQPAQQGYTQPQGYAATHNGAQPEEDDDIPF